MQKNMKQTCREDEINLEKNEEHVKRTHRKYEMKL